MLVVYAYVHFPFYMSFVGAQYFCAIFVIMFYVYTTYVLLHVVKSLLL